MDKYWLRMLDSERGHSVKVLQLYLSVSEAKEFVQHLNDLLADPEENDHKHLVTDGRDLSFSIVTPAKLESVGYTELEGQVFRER